MVINPAELRLMLGHIAGFFYARNHTQLRLSYPRDFLLYGVDNHGSLATGYDSRFSVYNAKPYKHNEHNSSNSREKRHQFPEYRRKNPATSFTGGSSRRDRLHFRRCRLRSQPEHIRYVDYVRLRRSDAGRGINLRPERRYEMITRVEDAKISGLAASMLADMQLPKECDDILDSMDYIIGYMILDLDPLNENTVLLKNLKTIVWTRKLLKELLKPSEDQ